MAKELIYGRDLDFSVDIPWSDNPYDPALAEAKAAERNAKLDANFAAMKEKAALQEPVLQEVDPNDNEIVLPTVSTEGPRVVTGDFTIFEFVQDEAASA